MSTSARPTTPTQILAWVAAGLLLAGPAHAQSTVKDRIGDLLRSDQSAAAPEAAAPTPEAAAADPREGDPGYEQARALMSAIDGILSDVAQQRAEAKKLPGKDEFLVTPLWTETKEDREGRIRTLLDATLGIVTDAPVVEVQKRIEQHRRNIRDLEASIVSLKEKQLTAPKDAMLPGVLTDTVASLGDKIAEHKTRIADNEAAIKTAKGEIAEALIKSGVDLAPDQLDLLLDGVLSGDLVRLVATFHAAKLIDGQLAKLMTATAENPGAARKYFAMHAALFALLVHAQDSTINKIDTQYMPKLDAILKDLAAAKAKTIELMRAENRPDQKRALEANRESQKLAEEAAKGYRRYLAQQREQIAAARTRATHDLRIADNTFDTVEASLELRNLMRDSSTSFEAIQKLEAPTFEQIFKNEELRREFENLTRKLDAPTS
ncbi:hypothetical protein [uncultured Hyphomicrobium sp.]|uniref:hypothetical protein n=1 Tax=uncultured Hyphomicrobium sp. TaxID=194373 RepID=UPI0025E17263|nr:hypothetical protein [uncultured Hyphomicrobium sp.]